MSRNSASRTPSAASSRSSPTSSVASRRLDTALAKYEDGVRLLRLCYDQLDRAGRSVALLMGVDDQGHPVTTPFDARATFAPDPAASPSPAAGDPRPGP